MSNEPTTTESRTLTIAERVGMALLALVLCLTGAVTFFLAPFFVMASDPCPSGSREGICDPGTQQLVAYLPWIGAPTLVIAGLVGMFHRRGHAVWGGLALLGLGAIWVINASLAQIPGTAP